MHIQQQSTVERRLSESPLSEPSVIRPWPIMLKMLPTIYAFEQLSAQKCCLLYYTQYCAHEYCNYATVYLQFYYF